LTGHERLGDEAISAILSTPFARRLTRLNLNMTGISAATADVLASRPPERLRVLSINANRGGPEFARRLARSSVFPSLWSLDLSYLHIGDEGVDYLARSKGFPHLKRLFLGGNDITSRGVRALAESTAMSSLRELNLSSNIAIDDEGVRALAESRFITDLVSLNIYGSKLSRAGFAILKRSPNIHRFENMRYCSPKGFRGDTCLGWS
jgi:Leucine-rich repeat (LRR) protein